jgi:hypothetical protein
LSVDPTEGTEMNMKFQVYKDGNLIFTSTIKLPEAAPMAQVNEFSKAAEIQFRKPHPDIDPKDVDLVQKWVKIEQPTGR